MQTYHPGPPNCSEGLAVSAVKPWMVYAVPWASSPLDSPNWSKGLAVSAVKPWTVYATARPAELL